MASEKRWLCGVVVTLTVLQVVEMAWTGGFCRPKDRLTLRDGFVGLKTDLQLVVWLFGWLVVICSV